MFKILLFLFFSTNTFSQLKEYDGYLIAIVDKYNFDTHYSNEYFFLPTNYVEQNKAINLDSLKFGSKHLPRDFEILIKSHNGDIVSNQNASSSNDNCINDFISMMYFYYENTNEKPRNGRLKKECFIKKYNKVSNIFAIRVKFTAQKKTNAFYSKHSELHIANKISIEGLKENEKAELKKFLKK